MENDTHTPRGRAVVKTMAEKIEGTFSSFDVPIEIVKAIDGLRRYHFHLKTLKPVRMKAIESFEKDLRYVLGSDNIEIQAPMPNETLIGITIPKKDFVPMLLWSNAIKSFLFTDSSDLIVPLGQDEFGNEDFINLARTPHMLISGGRSSGKSMFIDSIVSSLIHKNGPDRLRFIFVDPKGWELVQYNGLPHLLTPVITNPRKLIFSLKWCIKEMERRLDLFQEHRVQNISYYHERIYIPAKQAFDKKGSPTDEEQQLPESLPYIVIIVDELSHIMALYPKEFEANFVQLVQKSRAVGIHLILSTQRPTANVVTGLMKANIPSRVAFQVTSSLDSRAILDEPGAEKLLGNGDMLCLTLENPQPVHVQGYFISEEDIKKNVKDVVKKYKEEDTDKLFGDETNTESEIDDDLFEKAREILINGGKPSTSFLQRKFSIGYSRAARLMDILEMRGVIGPADGSKPREIVASNNE